ncbi:MAG: ribosome small subunit-dependent GTPase A [Bacteriovoracaceae bacterium]|nr:ribosome small subunit-dependent GTPase A [Bacteriovoracaceae bacterium]
MVVGDYVEVKIEANACTIMECQKRQNEIFRFIVRERKKKVTASNVDCLLIVMAASKPEYKEGLVDRYLLRSQQWNVPAIVIFNKMDEAADDFDIQFATERLKKIAPCFEISAKNPDYKKRFLGNGLNELKEYLKGKTALFLGQSGVGKSRLITCLSDGKAELLSNDLAKVGKGAHTTTWAEIIDCHHFELIDSPGVRSMAIEDMDIESLNSYFPDIFPYISQCQFSNCLHESNSKGCAFTTLDPGNVENQYLLSRLNSLKRFREELELTPSWQKKY